jgi:hypothetical protein
LIGWFAFSSASRNAVFFLFRYDIFERFHEPLGYRIVWMEKYIGLAICSGT